MAWGVRHDPKPNAKRAEAERGARGNATRKGHATTPFGEAQGERVLRTIELIAEHVCVWN